MLGAAAAMSASSRIGSPASPMSMWANTGVEAQKSNSMAGPGSPRCRADISSDNFPPSPRYGSDTAGSTAAHGDSFRGDAMSGISHSAGP